jgi:3-isopropylmalate/(R)-2-methylmalate dehydratase large subunit
MAAMTIAEKILARAAGTESVRPGDYIKAEADTIVMCDLAWLLAGPPIAELGARVLNPDKVIVAFDHNVPADNTASAEMHRNWREFCAEHGIEKLHDVGDHGISHVLSVERGYARPGTLQVSIDSHANTCGAVGCFAIAIGMDIISDMVLGWNWYSVPESILVELDGELREGTMVRDVAQHVVDQVGDRLGNGRVVEFVGPAVERMSISERMTLCNWSRKIQAVAGLVNPDRKTVEYVADRTEEPFEALVSDPDAEYAARFTIDVAALEPLVAAPPDPTNTQSLASVSGTPIQQAFIGSCAGGSLEDLRVAASVLDGRRVHPGVRMIASPGSQRIWEEADREGIIATLARAGCVVTASTCGACIGGMGALGDGEVCVSTSTENFPGRMGAAGSLVYLASPLTVAASAVAGALTDSRELA